MNKYAGWIIGGVTAAVAVLAIQIYKEAQNLTDRQSAQLTYESSLVLADQLERAATAIESYSKDLKAQSDFKFENAAKAEEIAQMLTSPPKSIDFESMARIGFSQADSLADLGLSQASMARELQEQALQYLKHSISLSSDPPATLYYRIGKLAAKMGLNEEAASHAQVFVEMAETDIRGYALLLQIAKQERESDPSLVFSEKPAADRILNIWGTQPPESLSQVELNTLMEALNALIQMEGHALYGQITNDKIRSYETILSKLAPYAASPDPIGPAHAALK
ncbi:hypothetical protein [Pontibacter sp. G13]|uniref:hypothetical protein n=1 Tax=Pontibacter sp. G13 TaxID=3074898 RepID=UPI00288A516D|nr:hypothetical protein [Pontibacter sp. G13]WNJ16251.1 hypothetical protein RJD25_15415 [Pontibacter sp. G13]